MFTPPPDQRKVRGRFESPDQMGRSERALSGLVAVWLVFLVAVQIVTVVAVWMVFWSRFGQWSCRGLVSIPCRVLVGILGRGLAIGPVVALI